MAITDKQFTGAELQEALADPTTGADMLKIVTGTILGDPKYLATIEPGIVAPVVKKIAEDTEQFVLDMTGIQKEGAEKYYEYRNRAFKLHLDKLNGELETAKTNPNPSEADKRTILDLKQQITDMKTAYDKSDKEKTDLLTKTTIKSAIDTSLIEIKEKFKKDIPKEALDALVEKAVNETMAEATLESDGKIVFRDATGNVLKHTGTNFENHTAVDRLGERLKSIIETPIVQPGAGSGPTPPTPPAPNGEPVKYNSRPATVTTQKEMTKYLLGLGVKHGSEEFDKAWTDAKDLPLG